MGGRTQRIFCSFYNNQGYERMGGHFPFLQPVSEGFITGQGKKVALDRSEYLLRLHQALDAAKGGGRS